ncbi:hypothetical protein EUX98_g3306 [Antrodiella citrinella]|uniref:Uncharacterized protein n=1 Tax=Antrodiella citrinella TaxID=2447956 RepID=A0A4S4MWT9_9APHY|nr:hypothetical protein EUX98_g3306 [Antrodiella citrinella]
MSSEENLTPTYIYKLVPSFPPPYPLPDRLPVSALDEKDQFLHLSTSKQVSRTLKLYFKDETKVYVLRISYDHVVKDIRWEDSKNGAPGAVGGEGIFPHLYNGLKLGRDVVESVQEWENGDGQWDEALKKAEGWLIY